jgi:glycosyltransferase involved in cell wall biosynthesis
VRVLYLIDSLFAGGAERSLAALAPYYRDLGVELHVGYFYEREGVRPELEAAGAKVHRLQPEDLKGYWWRVHFARGLIRWIEPDLVHTTLFDADIAGRIAARLTHRPVVSSLVNVNYGPEQLANPRIKSWRLRAAQLADATTARVVTRFHAVSGVVADEMAPRLHVRRDRIEVIPRGRDPVALGTRTDDRRAAARAALGVSPGERVVLAIGRQEYQKGFDVLVDAAASMAREVRVFIAGRDGNASTELRAAIEAGGLGEIVTMLGERADIAELLCAADVFAFPSRWEGMPGTVIEAMALEAPIVASDIASVREVVGDDCVAVLVPPGDPRALANAVTSTLDDPDAAARTARARHRFLDAFTIERSAAEMVRFYERVLALHSPNRRH